MKRKRSSKKRQNRKKKGAGVLFYLFHPGDLQKQIDSFGYSFSMGKYILFILSAIAGAAGCGTLFSLRWYYVVLLAAACVWSLPFLILDGYKQMYEHKRFLDVSDYLEQMLYSFRMSQKILSALKDTQSLFTEGRMRQVLLQAISYIEKGKYEKDLYGEALGMIEEEYQSSRLPAVHEYLRTVEDNGGACGDAIDLLLQDKAIWTDNVMLLQEDKKSARIRVVFSLAVTMVMALVFHSVYRSMPERYSIIENPATQMSTFIYLLLNVLIFCRANKELAKSWLIREEKGEERKLAGYYRLVASYNEKAERKKSWCMGGCFFLGAALLGGMGRRYGMVISAGIGVLLLNQHKMGYRVAFDRVVREVNRVFPMWLMEMALLLQGNNVQVSIEKTIEHAPVVLKDELQKMSDSLKRKPDAIEPYLSFLGRFRLSSVLSSMKMLYAISESGSGDTQYQIQVLVERNSKLMDKSEKLSNEKSLAGINGIFYLPQITVSLQTMVHMVVFMLMFLGQLKLS